MSLTIDEIQSEVSKNPELKKGLISSFKNDYTESLKAEGIILRSADEEKEFLTNYEKNIIPGKVESEIGQKVRAVHDQYDNDLFDLTGERKQPHEKTYDFLKRKMADLKKQKAAGNDDPVLADRIKELEKQTKERENWVSPDEVKKLRDKYFTDKINLSITSDLDQRAIAVLPHITEERAKQAYTATQKQMLKNDFLSRFTTKEDNEGNIVYYLDDVLQIDAHNGKSLTAKQLIDKHYAGYFVPEKQVLKGSGSGSNGSTNNVDVNEASLKSKDEVMDYLVNKFKEQGIRSGHPQFNKEYQRIIKDYAITQ